MLWSVISDDLIEREHTSGFVKLLLCLYISVYVYKYWSIQLYVPSFLWFIQRRTWLHDQNIIIYSYANQMINLRHRLTYLSARL